MNLTEIANTPGFGTGKAARDRLAAESECRAMLPEPRNVPPVIAATDSHWVLMCHFGNSNEDDQDWAVYHDGRESDVRALGDDAKSDAQCVAAIINAYRMGILVPAK